MWILSLVFIVAAQGAQIETRTAHETFADRRACLDRAQWWMAHDAPAISRGQAMLGGSPGLCAPAGPLTS